MYMQQTSRYMNTYAIERGHPFIKEYNMERENLEHENLEHDNHEH